MSFYLWVMDIMFRLMDTLLCIKRNIFKHIKGGSHFYIAVCILTFEKSYFCVLKISCSDVRDDYTQSFFGRESNYSYDMLHSFFTEKGDKTVSKGYCTDLQ